MAVNRFYLLTLIVFVFLLGYLNYQIWKPFLIPIAWAIVLSILFYPLYAFILKLIRQRALSSALILGLILILIIGPFSYLTFMLIMELRDFSDYMAGGKLETIKNLLQHPGVLPIIEKATSLLNLSPSELDKTIAENLSRFGKDLATYLTKGVREILTVTFHFFIMAFSIFFFLKDGPIIFNRAKDFLPFSEQQKGRLVKQIRDMIITTIFGGVIVAIVQGILGGIAFSIVGIPSPILWGGVMAIASFLPLIGPFIIWGPAAVFLIVEGAILKGVALILMGALGISMIDNLLRPYIIGNRTRMPFLAIFFSVLGGIKLFGLIGFILGPLVLAIFISVIEIFRSIEELKPT
jgi:predicted PurR-regulated permease PerM